MICAHIYIRVTNDNVYVCFPEPNLSRVISLAWSLRSVSISPLTRAMDRGWPPAGSLLSENNCFWWDDFCFVTFHFYGYWRYVAWPVMLKMNCPRTFSFYTVLRMRKEIRILANFLGTFLNIPKKRTLTNANLRRFTAAPVDKKNISFVTQGGSHVVGNRSDYNDSRRCNYAAENVMSRATQTRGIHWARDKLRQKVCPFYVP